MRNPVYLCPPKKFVSLILVCALTLLFINPVFAQEGKSRKPIIRGGLTGVIGKSTLYLDDAVRATNTTNEYYSFNADLFLKVGALVAVQVPFLSEKIQFIFDPSFSKYSYGDGDNHEQKTDSVINYIDLDIDALEIPFSIRYSFLPPDSKIQPYVRGEYTFAYFVDKQALTLTKLLNDNNSWDEYRSEAFNFANYQNLFSASLGIEFNYELVDYTLEFVAELGDGIHERKGGADYMKISRTTSFYVQMGVLF